MNKFKSLWVIVLSLMFVWGVYSFVTNFPELSKRPTHKERVWQVSPEGTKYFESCIKGQIFYIRYSGGITYTGIKCDE